MSNTPEDYTWFKDRHGLGFGYTKTDEEGGFVVVKRLPNDLIAEEAKTLALNYLRQQKERYERLAETATHKARVIRGAMTMAGDPESFDAFLESLNEDEPPK